MGSKKSDSIFGWPELQALLTVRADETVIEPLFALGVKYAGEVGGIIDRESTQHAELGVDTGLFSAAPLIVRLVVRVDAKRRAVDLLDSTKKQQGQ
jgi:hypothetical protein